MANLKTTEKKTKAQSMGLHTEVLTGKTQQKFFNPDEAENFYYWGTYDVDFNKRIDLDVMDLDCKEANRKISATGLRQKAMKYSRAASAVEMEKVAKEWFNR